MKGRLGDTRRKRLVAFVSLAVVLGSAGCSGGNGAVVNSDGGLDGALDAPEDRDPADAKTDPKAADGGASALFSPAVTSPLDFPTVPCGGAAETEALTVTNKGSAVLAVSAATAGTGFSVSPTMLQVQAGKSATLTVSAAAPSSATAGVPFVGGLNLDTNDPSQRSLTYQLSATPTGATLAIQPQPTFDFAPTAVGIPASAINLTVVNTGNAPGTFTFGAPTVSLFSISLDGPDGGQLLVNLNAGASSSVWAGFTPTNTTLVTATSSITPSGATCGTSPLSVAFSGVGATGDVGGWPATVDFGPSDCGGSAPANQTFTLTNTGPVDAHVTSVLLTGAPGFTTDADVGRTIPAQGLSKITVTAPAVPANVPVTPITATLTIETDADTSAHVITLTEEPSGAILAFDTSPTPNFGSFGPVQLLGSATQYFNVRNTGSASASVTLVALANGDAGAPSSFSISPAAFAIGSGGAESESATFTPVSANGVTGSIAMATATGSICGALPAPMPLSGSGLGGGPVVTQSSLTFLANCGGAPPGAQSFMVQNDGTADLTWSMSGPTGAGASQYTVTADPPPGLLIPGASATVNVAARAVPSPAPNPAPSAFAAQLTITTDVPLDPPHVVSLGETPLGDQLSFWTPGPLKFGQVPIDTMLSQPFTVANFANSGSPAATVFFAVGGTGAGGYLTPAPFVNLSPGAAASENLSFFPTSDVAYPAVLGPLTTDPVCTPLPSAISLSGTGTQGVVSVSAATLAFGTSPSDPQGLVNCGSSGLAHSLTVSSVGNQPFQITGLALGQGASSPYTLSGSGTLLPATVPIGGSVTIVVTPLPIPESVLNPSDPTPFSDTLTLTTNAALDTPHAVQLVMQARGAVVTNTSLATTWTFGTVSFGSIGTFTSSIQNNGNAGVSVALNGVAQPSIFGLQSNPTKGGNGVTPLVGQFTPPAADGQWSDTGILVVTAQQAFCAPLPSEWDLPTIHVSGASNSAPAVTVSGDLAFPSTACGSAAPAGQTVLLSNDTNVAYAYEANFNSGKYYTLSSPASGTIAANGSSMLIVTPTTVTPGPGVTPGSALYADDLVITVATSPPTQWTVPISWALDGAVLTLPFGAGTRIDGAGNLFYPADSSGAFSLSMGNTGTASASVDFAIAPPGAFAFSPAPPVQIIPSIGATPALVSSDSDSVCPAATVSTATFVYSGPVCQPFPVSHVTIEACFGTF
jgi:hypothetical protein